MINSAVVTEHTEPETFHRANEGIWRAGWWQGIVKVVPSALPFSAALAAATEQWNC